MLDRARFLVISEISEVTHQPMTGVETMVDEALCKCFKTKDESVPVRRPVTATAVAMAAKVVAPKVATATRATARRAMSGN
jgi:hypothetical protein